MNKVRLIISVFALVQLLTSCNEVGNEKKFTIRTGQETGIDFINQITASDTLHALTFEYIYNGSGVGVGDFNNDGLDDLFFGGNQVSSELYLNDGKMKFRKVTTESGVQTNRWVTGVSVIDINNDGLLDIFLAVAGKAPTEQMKDLLFINQGIDNGIPRFKEMASEYGLADPGYATMGAFFDYDKDGDPDLYLVRNAMEPHNRNNLRQKRVAGEASSTDKLFRNNGDNTFTDVSAEAGILIEGYGLGVVITDINQDSWPDIYVSNDFMSNDLLWINQGNGTFSNHIGKYLKHQTHNGMGCDIADFNNDGLADIMVVDMLPPGHRRQKMMTAGQNFDHFHMSEKMGFEAQYMRNTLQLNRGRAANGDLVFSEIAFHSNVSATDWSWAPLFADFDNDGFKDLFVANGYRKDVTDLDFIYFGLKSASPFGTPEKRKEKFDQELANLAEVKLSNKIFRNNGTLAFEDKTKDWGIELPTFSNGAAYADLDADGDLDLITNNIDQEVIVYENVSGNASARNRYMTFRSREKDHFNQRIILFSGGQAQYQEATPYRGFQSTVSSDVHFGVGKNARADSVFITYPNGKSIRFYDVPTDTLILYSLKDAGPTKPFIKETNQPIAFRKVTLFSHRHEETSPSDIKITRTLMQEVSHAGPCIAAADVNNDGLDDVFVGAEKNQNSKLYIQNKNGGFTESTIHFNKTSEDGDALFFDFDNDNDPDLYIASSAHSSNEAPSEHRLFRNNGQGVFQYEEGLLPDIMTSSRVVVNADYDGDGDQDLFVGGWMKQSAYPLPGRSYILRNDRGRFTDVTEQVCRVLLSPGLVTSAVWKDIDLDKKPDLIIAGHWMPVMVFKNKGSAFDDVTDSFGLTGSDGWWNTLEVADVNSDGYPDILAGNTGTNSYFRPTAEHPVTIVAKDFDKNGSVDPIVTYFNPVENDRFMVHNRMVIIDQIPAMKRRFEKFGDFAERSFEKAFLPEELKDAYEKKLVTLTSCIWMNQGGTKFKSIALPEEAQFSAIQDFVLQDINNDQHVDIIAVGNNHSQETLFGRYDASIGVILLGDGKGAWNSVNPLMVGLNASKDAKCAMLIGTSNSKFLLIGNNNSEIEFFNLITSPQKELHLSKLHSGYIER